MRAAMTYGLCKCCPAQHTAQLGTYRSMFISIAPARGSVLCCDTVGKAMIKNSVGAPQRLPLLIGRQL